MEKAKMNHTRNAKLFGSFYFILLALVNFNGALLYWKLSWYDVVLLAITCFPLLVDKKLCYLFYGLINGLIWMLYGILIFSRFVESIQLEKFLPARFVLVGFGLAIAGLLASLSLVYAGINSEEKNRFSFL